MIKLSDGIEFNNPFFFINKSSLLFRTCHDYQLLRFHDMLLLDQEKLFPVLLTRQKLVIDEGTTDQVFPVYNEISCFMFTTLFVNAPYLC